MCQLPPKKVQFKKREIINFKQYCQILKQVVLLRVNLLWFAKDNEQGRSVSEILRALGCKSQVIQFRKVDINKLKLKLGRIVSKKDL